MARASSAANGVSGATTTFVAEMPKTVRPERRLEIIVATIGVVAALAGAATGGATSYLVQRNQFTEDKASEARVKRAGVLCRVPARGE